ncbi:MAG: hypothetical protein Q8R47_01825 [Nanoarchaeota archaeon]|nr:hypothetical protein [Nanoarchaeota archaeon]
MIEEKVYISFMKKGTEKPWQLLRITEPGLYAPERSVDDSYDPCAVETERVLFYQQRLAEKGYETTVTQLDSKTRGVYVVNELENLANLLWFQPTKGDSGYTADLHPPHRK